MNFYRVWEWFNQVFCDHEMIRLTDPAEGRYYTRCMKCGFESPGIFTGPQHS